MPHAKLKLPRCPGFCPSYHCGRDDGSPRRPGRQRLPDDTAENRAEGTRLADASTSTSTGGCGTGRCSGPSTSSAYAQPTRGQGNRCGLPRCPSGGEGAAWSRDLCVRTSRDHHRLCNGARRLDRWRRPCPFQANHDLVEIDAPAMRWRWFAVWRDSAACLDTVCAVANGGRRPHGR